MEVDNRKSLQEIREAADAYEKGVLNPHWKRAWVELAKAADHCDAIIARCTETESSPPR